MNFREAVKEYFPKEFKDLLKDLPAEDPDFRKMSIKKLKTYVATSD